MVLLEVKDLKVHFKIENGWVKAVDGVSFTIDKGETMGLVGESGCGKTTAAYAITQLLPSNGYIKGGRIFFKEPERVTALREEYDRRFSDAPKERDKEAARLKKELEQRSKELGELVESKKQLEESKSIVPASMAKRLDELRAQVRELDQRLSALTCSYDLLAKSMRKDGSMDDWNREIRKVRWQDISMIFQGAMNAFNPVFKIGDQIVAAIQLHEDIDDDAARKRVSELFEFVGIPQDRMDNYPHEFSGGMKQRAMIALALALSPAFIIADEPTTALDVITQDRILFEMKKLQEGLRMAMMIITHDVSVVAEVSDKIAVMYAGKIMEIGPTNMVFKRPAHPYTSGLLGSFPSIKGKKRRLESIPGFPPDLVNPPSGCPFHPRCQYAKDLCLEKAPDGIEIEPGHVAFCHFSKELWERMRRDV
ncbi:MAG: ATP-binding cassette domain-containing protein [Candidatus Thermoplasmatota archaeon]|nr:ATP-binding cassette domain-containing protein [Candidatus Thermoplasmatota archaeon]